MSRVYKNRVFSFRREANHIIALFTVVTSTLTTVPLYAERDVPLTDSIEIDSIDSPLSIDPPSSYYITLDSLLDDWYARQYITFDSTCLTSSANITFNDTIYAERLSSLPTIIDMPYNYYTRSYIDAYTGRNREIISYSLAMMNRYEEIFINALNQYDVPIELKYLPIIESALKPKAYSRMGAAGLWQFIYSTGRNYNLYVNSLVDDRYDIVKSSYAAAKHLKDLYNIFGDWSLAIAAYNCGPGNVSKAITRSGGKRDFWEIYPYLPRETRGYLPAFIAVNYAMTFHKEHGICAMISTPPTTLDTLHINRNLHLQQIVDICGIDKEMIKALNPQFLTDIIPGAHKEYILNLPLEYIRPLVEAGDSLYEHNKELLFSKSKLAYIDDEMKNRKSYILHKIQSGETLSSIAIKYHTSVKSIKSWNNLSSDNIRAGRSLRIYNR